MVEELEGYSVKRPTPREQLYNATIIVRVDHRDGVNIDKNRYGEHGKVSTKELINILSMILVNHVFDGRMKLFQEAMRLKLKSSIKKILKEGA